MRALFYLVLANLIWIPLSHAEEPCPSELNSFPAAERTLSSFAAIQTCGHLISKEERAEQNGGVHFDFSTREVELCFCGGLSGAKTVLKFYGEVKEHPSKYFQSPLKTIAGLWNFFRHFEKNILEIKNQLANKVSEYRALSATEQQIARCHAYMQVGLGYAIPAATVNSVKMVANVVRVARAEAVAIEAGTEIPKTGESPRAEYASLLKDVESKIRTLLPNKILSPEEARHAAQLISNANKVSIERLIQSTKPGPEGRVFVKLFEDKDSTVWGLLWEKKPGIPEGTEIHGHGRSQIGVYVQKGTIREQYFNFPSAEPVVRDLGEGQSVALSGNWIHRVTNPGVQDAISVHVYSPPLAEMEFYKPDGQGLLNLIGKWKDNTP